MGLILGLISKVLRLFIYFIIFAAIIVIIPNLPPYTSFTRIDLEPTQPLAGPLALNNHLNNVQQLYKGKLLGPEAFQIYKGELYTSLATGEIVKVSPGGHVTFVMQIGQSCGGIKEESICGRPLGFVIDENKNLLYVADAYHGIWTVDLKSNKKTQLVSPRVDIEGRTPKLFNSVVLDSKGNLYYTDSSSDFQLQDGAFTLLTDPSGRLFQYNAPKNESKVLLDNLWLANGLVVSPDNQFIVVAETAAYRLVKYYINGPKKGKQEVFFGGLPGTPDNLRPLPDGSGLQAALYVLHSDDEPIIAHTMVKTPLARKFIARLLHLAQLAFEKLNKLYPHVVFEDAIYSIGHFKTLSGLLPKKSGLIHFDWDGKIIGAYYHTDGNHVSDAVLYQNKIHLGQPHGQDYIGVVPAPESYKKAFTPKQEKKRESKPEPEPVKVVEAPKPTQAPTTTKPPTQAPTRKPTVQATTQKPPVQTTTQRPVQSTTQKPPARTTQKPVQSTTEKPVQAAPSKPAAQAAPSKPAAQAAPSKPAAPAAPSPAEKKGNAAPPSPPKDTKPKVKEQPPQAKPTPAPKPVEPKKQAKPDSPKEKAPQEIPITEELPSDTKKPSKETLKVIKKEGPTEIPNPEL